MTKPMKKPHMIDASKLLRVLMDIETEAYEEIESVGDATHLGQAQVYAARAQGMQNAVSMIHHHLTQQLGLWPAKEDKDV